MPLSQYRVDVEDFEVTTKIMEKLQKARKVEKYFVSKEIGLEKGKKHIQGWVSHSMTDNSYRKSMAKSFEDIKSDGKCFTLVKKEEGFYSYIIKNRSKGASKVTIETLEELELEDYVKGGYEDKELVELYNKIPFHEEKEDFKSKQKEKKKQESFFDKAFNEIERECTSKDIKGNVKIDYTKILDTYLSMCPKQLDSYLVERNLNGVTSKLERKYKHKDNRRLRSKIEDDLLQGKYGCVYFDLKN